MSSTRVSRDEPFPIMKNGKKIGYAKITVTATVILDPNVSEDLSDAVAAAIAEVVKKF